MILWPSILYLKLRNILAKLALKEMYFKDINVIPFLPGGTSFIKVKTLRDVSC